MKISKYLKSHQMKALYVYFITLYLFSCNTIKSKTAYQHGFSKVKIWPYLLSIDIIKLLCFNEKTDFLAVLILSQSKGFNYCNYC